ncbi:MAG TPA: hypothetical protein VFJ95_04145, partial [Gammaproteobacteria bacterium]|nr:hypothetical protein [Gammaproteobacteria bacterium]
QSPALSAQEIEHELAAESFYQAPPEVIAALEAQAQLLRPELDHAVYDEYVRGFDDVPTLLDVVGSPPRRVVQPDFRRGERPDRRKEPRLDALTEREARGAELEQLYQEYARPDSKPSTARAADKKPKRGKPRRPGKRKKR